MKCQISVSLLRQYVSRLVLFAPRKRRGDVAHGGVEPYVEKFVGIARDLESKVGLVARDVPVLEAFVDPCHDEVSDFVGQGVRFGKFAEFVDEIAQRDEEMAGFADDRR